MIEIPGDIWKAADEIADTHSRHGWFRTLNLVAKIRLRSDIIDILMQERGLPTSQLAAAKD